MTLDQLIDRLVSIRDRNRGDNLAVGVCVTRLNAVGGTPITPIKSVISGGDWDSNKVIIYTDIELREADRDELAKLKKELADIGWTAMEFNRLKRENAKLRKELNK